MFNDASSPQFMGTQRKSRDCTAELDVRTISDGKGISTERDEARLVHIFSEFPEMLMSKLDKQRKNSVMCDVTIITEDGGSFRAHKSVLAASSRYLEAELCSLAEDKMDSSSEAVVHLGMISSVSFEALLDLVYTSKLVLTKDNAAEVLLAADILDLEQVGAICRQFLRSRITSKSVNRHTLRRNSFADSLSAEVDVNNNVFGVSYYKKGTRGDSNDSTTSSSSGFSSCSSTLSTGRDNDIQSSFVEEVARRTNKEKDSTPDQILESIPRVSSAREKEGPKSASLLDLSNLLKKQEREEDGRSYSAPPIPTQSKNSEESNSEEFEAFSGKLRRCESQESECHSSRVERDSGKFSSFPSEDVQHHKNKIPPRLLSVLPKSDNLNFGEDEIRNSKKRINTDQELDDSASTSCNNQYQVKSEVHIVPGFYPNNEVSFPSAQVVDQYYSLNSDSTSSVSTESALDTSVHPRYSSRTILGIEGPNGLSSYPQTVQPERHPTMGSYAFTYNTEVAKITPNPAPIMRSRSSEDRLFLQPQSKRTHEEMSLSAQPGFVDLNSTPSSQKSKVKSDEFQGLYKNMYNPASAPPGIFQDTSSFLASLYMLRSQALNPANFFNASYNLQNRSRSMDGSGASSSIQNLSRKPTAAPSTHTKRPLQHSNSVVTSSGLFCKLCRVEFASEWSLSMHHRLYHPFNYFYQPESIPSNTIGSKLLSPQQNGMLPFSRSTSSPGKIDVTLTDKMQDNQVQPGSFDLSNICEPQISHKCYHCKKEFASIYLLRKHKSTEHMKRPFKCHRCESAFPNKAGLSVHERSHTGERPYRCKVCDKAFTQLGHVQRHQKVHTGEKPYQCPLCQARVRDKASMHYHILAHRGVKPFKCDQCDARFTKRSSLVKHKNVHTGSFLYQCPQCKASFREKASLSRHVRSQHKEPCFTASLGLVSQAMLDASSMSMKPIEAPVNLTTDSHVDVVRVV